MEPQKKVDIMINMYFRNPFSIFIYIIPFLIWAISPVFPQTSSSSIRNYRIHKENFPDISLILEIDKSAKIPVQFIKKDFKIIETSQQYQKEISPLSIQILDTYVIKSEPPSTKRNPAIYSLILDSTKSLRKKDFRKLKSWAQKFIQTKQKKDIISLYKLNRKAKRIQYFTRSKKRLLKKLKRIQRNGKETKLYDSLYKTLLDIRKYAKTRKKEEIGGVILFTDGKEESSFLTTKDINELIIHGTKFSIPIYIVIPRKIKNQKVFKILKKLSLKTGGEILIGQFNPADIFNNNENQNNQKETLTINEFFIKKLEIRYHSYFRRWNPLSNPEIQVEIWYQDRSLGKFSYILYHKKYDFILYALIGIIITAFFFWLIWYFRKEKRRKQIQEEKTSDTIDFPEPEIGEVFADLRQYKDKPEKKYIETEEKPDIPLIAKNWIEPSYAPYLDDVKVRKKFSRDTLTLSLKEKSYIVLQMALKEAPKYKHASLIKKDREGAGYNKKYDLFLEEVYIGSSASTHIPVSDPAISQIHAKIKKIDNKYILFDLMSVAGTYLNGKKVLKPMPLRHNDEIRMGHTIFRFIGEDS